MEDDYIIAHAFTFFLDGFETSSLAMAYTLLELSLHPEVQEEARREIKNVLEKHNHKITHAALLEMTYLDNVISGNQNISSIQTKSLKNHFRISQKNSAN